MEPRPGGVLDRPLTLEAAVSVLLCFLLGLRIDALPYVPVAGLLGLALLPAMITEVRRFRGAVALMALLGLGVISGAVLTGLHTVSHVTSRSALVSTSAMALALIGGIAVILYARVHIGSAGAAIAYAVGMVGAIPLDPVSTANPWRFTLSVPITILVLAFLSAKNRLLPQLVALVGLAMIGMANDSRSNSAMLLLAAVILVWQKASTVLTGRNRRAMHFVGLLLVGTLMYQLAYFSLLEGYFGEAAQEKTAAQIAQSGSLLLGGRPEAAASFALIALYPLGLGAGVIANSGDISAAKSAMLAIGYDPDNGYVNRFMFGSGVEVHSVLGDIWLWFGLAGVAACALMIVIVVGGLVHRLANMTLTALLAYLAVRFFWDLLFSPVASTTKLLLLTIPLIAIAVPVMERRRPQRASRPRPRKTLTAIRGGS